MTATVGDLHERIDQLAQIQSEVLGAGVTREVYTAAYTEADGSRRELDARSSGCRRGSTPPAISSGVG